jgi:hypothetical protein
LKKHFLNALLIFLFHFSFSQNWSVINLSDKFNYRLNNDQIITATVWADSFQLNGADTILFLNRIMCDTCVTIIGGPNPCDTCYAAKNRPQFFQRQVSVSPNGIVNFLDTGNVVLNTLANLNDSWVFDSTWNVSATVISLGMDSVFGNFDSVKTILLSSGDTIILSQNFGVLQFPKGYGQNSYYRLVGIEGRNLGEQVPKFSDFFNFDIGDMFEYHDIGYFVYGCQGIISDYQGCNIIRKYLVVNKNISGDTISYQIQGNRIQYCFALGMPWIRDTCIDLINETDTYIDSSDHFCNKFNREFLPLDYNLSADTFIFFKIYDALRMRNDMHSVTTKSFGAQNIGTPTEYYYDTLLSQASDTLTNAYFGGAYCAYSGTYRVGLGLTDYARGACFEGSYESHLMAYRKGNDTVGIFTTDSVFTVGLSQLDHKEQIIISPNPSDNLVRISFPINNEAEVFLIDIQGKILITASINDSSIELNVSHIESGIYFITIKSSDGIFSKKVLIQR